MAHEEPTVNLLPKKSDISPILSERKARAKIGNIIKLLSIAAIFLVAAGAFASTKISRTSATEPVAAGGFSFFSSLKRLVGAPDKVLGGAETDRINFLLLGIGGAGHAGPELTDTMLLASYQPSSNKVGMISIPRDLTVNIQGYGYRKINAVNAYAEMDAQGTGVDATAAMIKIILGQTVDYTIKVDFGGFEEILNDVGGIDVYVDNSFIDTTYPLDDKAGNVQTVNFSAGWTHMTGATALKYARSRHGNNGEGSDFARAVRQQKVLLALKDRALSLNVLLNPAKLNNIISTVRKNISTDMSIWDMVRVAAYVSKIDTKTINLKVLDTASNSPLYSTMINDAYVILPRNEDWSDLKLIAANIFTDVPVVTSQVAALPDKPTSSDGVRIEIQNGTPTSGLAARTAELLQGSGFTIALVSNAVERDYKKTIIYDYTNGKKAEELASLKKYLDADVVMTPQGYLSSNAVTPDSLGTAPAPMGEKVDFLIIIGENGQSLVMK